jgi:hypothetical protein
MIEEGAKLEKLTKKEQEELVTIGKVYEQQLEMYEKKTNKVENRIVSVSQPHVRPIVRGKAGKAVEFGAKISASNVNGFVFLDKLSWDNSKYRTKGLKSIRERGFMEDERNVRKPMNQYNALKQALKPHLGWHGARLSFLALFLLALLKVKTVNLKELALGFEGRALVDSHYKRLQRFFSGFELDYHHIARIVVSWLDIPQPWVLSIDRTTWEFGSNGYNILTVGIVHEGVAIPILWWMLSKKKGNSNSDERMRFIEEMLKIFPTALIRCLSELTH